MEWLLIMQLLNPATDTSSVISQAFESRAVCEKHVTNIGLSLGLKNGSKTLDGSEVILQCVAKTDKV